MRHQLLGQLSWESLKARSPIDNLTCVLKCLRNIALNLLKSYFNRSSHVYSTRRNGLNILFPKVHTESARKGTFYTGAQAFNNLPPHLKEVDSILVFKTLLNDILRLLVHIFYFYF